MKNRLKLLIVCIITFAFITGCSTGSYIAIGAKETNTSSKMSMSYHKFDGYKTTRIHVGEGEVVEVSVNIVSTKGKLGLTIVDDKDQTTYEGSDIPTSDFKVILDKAGDYKVTVKADDHKGSFKISWHKVEKK